MWTYFPNNRVSGNFCYKQGDQEQLANLGDYSNLTQFSRINLFQDSVTNLKAVSQSWAQEGPGDWQGDLPQNGIWNKLSDGN